MPDDPADHGAPSALFLLGFDDTPDPWFLSDLVPSIDSWSLRRGERVEDPGDMRITINEPGQALDVTMSGGPIVIVSERVGARVAALAADDVQRIPVHIDGAYGRYELLHVLSRIDAVDRERTKAYAYRPGAAVGEYGTVASLAPIIGDDSLYGCVMESDMTLSTAGIIGPRIFRVVRWDLWPVVTSEIKDALERLGATGVSYTSLRTAP